MSGLRLREDAFGHAILDHLEGRAGITLIERDDGMLRPDGGPAVYFRPFPRWAEQERRAIRLARGRVLDVGCGAGRVALHLQERGHTVVAIDNLPLAIRACRRRGVRDARLLGIEDLGPRLGTFDTIVMYGGNFGLVGSASGARRYLRRFARLAAEGARILAASLDPYRTDDPAHLRYHRRNRRRGRMSGQIRFCVRYLAYASPWLDYLIVSPKELRALAAGTGWHVARVIKPRPRAGAPGRYIAILER